MPHTDTAQTFNRRETSFQQRVSFHFLSALASFPISECATQPTAGCTAAGTKILQRMALTWLSENNLHNVH